MKSGKGKLICFLGVDGSGKTTAAQNLCQALNRAGVNCHYRRLTPSLLRLSPSKLRHRTEIPLDAPLTDKASPAQNQPKSQRIDLLAKTLIWASLSFHLVESLMIYLFKVKPALSQSVVIYDRYFYDYAVIYLAACPRWLLWCYRKFLPKPDILFLLDVDPLVAENRDGEYPRNLYLQLQKRYHEFVAGLNPQIVSISNANKPKEEVAQFVWERVQRIIKVSASDG